MMQLAVSVVLAGLWTACPSGDYELGHIWDSGGSHGHSGVGGALGTGGSPGTGGSGVGGSAVTFSDGQAEGAMTGFGWVALGSEDTVTAPTCGPSHDPITSSAACASTVNWSPSDRLCVSGFVPALPANPEASDYANNWGIQVGVDATNPVGGGLGQSYANLTIDMTGIPAAAGPSLRAVVHRRGDPASTTYCAPVTSGVAIPFTGFSTLCFVLGGGGSIMTAADVPSIDSIGVQISSESTAVTVSDFCITGIKLGN